MSDGASDLIALYEMPTDAYKALKAIDPNHELCKLYEGEWFKEGAKPGIAARFAPGAGSVAKVVLNFADAMREAVSVAEGRPTPPAPQVSLPTDIAEVIPEPTPSPSITW